MVINKKEIVMHMNSICNFVVLLMLLCFISCSKNGDTDDMLADNTNPTSNTPQRFY